MPWDCWFTFSIGGCICHGVRQLVIIYTVFAVRSVTQVPTVYTCWNYMYSTNGRLFEKCSWSLVVAELTLLKSVFISGLLVRQHKDSPEVGGLNGGCVGCIDRTRF